MDSKKLAQIIKLVVEQEIKKQLPKLVKEEVEKKMKVLQERKSTPIEDVELDPFALAESLLQKERQTQQVQQTQRVTEVAQRQFTKNPVLNNILNQTKPFSAAQRTAGPVGGGSSVLDNFQTQQPIQEAASYVPNFMDAEPDIESTIEVGNVAPQLGLESMRAQMAAKMGYGDMGGGSKRGGLGVTTGLPGLDRILNRDNSELVKRFKK
jgi:hypothetical protein